MAAKNNDARIADALEAINEKLGGDDANHLEAVAENLADLVDSFDILLRSVDRMSWEIGRK